MKSKIIPVGERFGSLTILGDAENNRCIARCDCGNISYPHKYSLLAGRSKSCGKCSKNLYNSLDKETTELTSTNGYKILIDTEDVDRIKEHKWCVNTCNNGYLLVTSKRIVLSRLLMGFPKDEVDHINLNSLDNRKQNLRIVTHQQNQINQPLQRNNTSGASGVSFYPPRNKFRARIKIAQNDIHLGYYLTFEEAVQARNVGMECMFGEYARYNDVPSAPNWIRAIVVAKCRRFSSFSVNPNFWDIKT